MLSKQVLLFSIVIKFVAMFIGVCGNIAVIILTHTSKFWSKEKTETSFLAGNLARLVIPGKPAIGKHTLKILSFFIVYTVPYLTIRCP